jgi:lysophospholipase L1-like esterase
MIRKLLAPLLLSAWLAGCGQDLPKLPALDEEAVIVAFGDSLTHGTGAGAGQSYPEVLSGLLGREVINAGIPGERTDQGLARLASVLQEYQPDLLLLCYGGNDFLQQSGEEQAARNLAEMVRISQNQGIGLVLIGVPKPGLWLSSAGFYQEIAERFKLPFDGQALPEILSDNRLKSDLVHPNAEGYRKLAEAVAKLLKQAGAVQ